MQLFLNVELPAEVLEWLEDCAKANEVSVETMTGLCLIQHMDVAKRTLGEEFPQFDDLVSEVLIGK